MSRAVGSKQVTEAAPAVRARGGVTQCASTGASSQGCLTAVIIGASHKRNHGRVCLRLRSLSTASMRLTHVAVACVGQGLLVMAVGHLLTRTRPDLCACAVDGYLSCPRFLAMKIQLLAGGTPDWILEQSKGMMGKLVTWGPSLQSDEVPMVISWF